MNTYLNENTVNVLKLLGEGPLTYEELSQDSGLCDNKLDYVLSKLVDLDFIEVME